MEGAVITREAVASRVSMVSFECALKPHTQRLGVVASCFAGESVRRSELDAVERCKRCDRRCRQEFAEQIVHQVHIVVKFSPSCFSAVRLLADGRCVMTPKLTIKALRLVNGGCQASMLGEVLAAQKSEPIC